MFSFFIYIFFLLLSIIKLKIIIIVPVLLSYCSRPPTSCFPVAFHQYTKTTRKNTHIHGNGNDGEWRSKNIQNAKKKREKSHFYFISYHLAVCNRSKKKTNIIEIRIQSILNVLRSCYLKSSTRKRTYINIDRMCCVIFISWIHTNGRARVSTHSSSHCEAGRQAGRPFRRWGGWRCRHQLPNRKHTSLQCSRCCALCAAQTLWYTLPLIAIWYWNE